jgi:hypothetical protein
MAVEEGVIQTFGEPTAGVRFIRFGSVTNDEAPSPWPRTSEAILPRKVVEWAGLRSSRGEIAGESPLVDLNDKQRLTFPELADVIEKYMGEL